MIRSAIRQLRAGRALERYLKLNAELAQDEEKHRYHWGNWSEWPGFVQKAYRVKQERRDDAMRKAKAHAANPSRNYRVARYAR